jgi:Putative peptidoglycan binding domain
MSRAAFQRPNANFATNRFTGSPRAFTNVNRSNFSRTNFNRADPNRSRVNLSRASNLNRFGNFNRSGTNFNNFNGRRGDFVSRNGNRWRRHCDDRFVFFFDPFFFPWSFPFWGYPYYSYYPYPYSYDSYGYDPYGYGSGYQTSGQIYYPSGTDYTDDQGYSDSGAQEETGPYDRDNRASGSIIARVQEQLARDGYYKGRIDGVQGSRTYYAIRAYERDHGLRVDGAVSDQLLSEMGLR